MTEAIEATGSELDKLELADWRRRVSDLYAKVRASAATNPSAAWDHWREVRESLYRYHSQSPVPDADRAAFRAHHWPYNPAFRFDLPVIREAPTPSTLAPLGGGFGSLLLPVSTGGEQSFSRIGFIDVPFPAGARRLGLYWMAGYAGGLFLPFRDATNGAETYGAGRYLLDAAKSADLGGDASAGTLILDFNFAFQPSCSFDPRWSCPLSPPENRLDIRIEAGERLT
ncbi:MAG TPA: DUF1684 domain-containing protein [Candidatus Limnocylindrales bacterium]|nr:DUF1684 domain-containing protein [Candidatus Limnocylindrales bacterium]